MSTGMVPQRPAASAGPGMTAGEATSENQNMAASSSRAALTPAVLVSSSRLHGRSELRVTDASHQQEQGRVCLE